MRPPTKMNNPAAPRDTQLHDEKETERSRRYRSVHVPRLGVWIRSLSAIRTQGYFHSILTTL